MQAKNILRSIDEHAYTIFLLAIRPELADDFVLTNDDESANRFWWKHIRGCREVVDKAIGSLLQERDVLRDNVFRTEERQLLSTAHHPSYVASTMPFLVPYNRANISMYMFGLPSEYSYRTAKLLFYILAEISIYIAFLNQGVRKFIEEKSDDPLQEAVECVSSPLVLYQ